MLYRLLLCLLAGVDDRGQALGRGAPGPTPMSSRAKLSHNSCHPDKGILLTDG
jgi:hypothetical protein